MYKTYLKGCDVKLGLQIMSWQQTISDCKEQRLKVYGVLTREIIYSQGLFQLVLELNYHFSCRPWKN